MFEYDSSISSPVVVRPVYGIGQRDTVVHALARSAAAFSDYPFVTVDGVQLTFSQVDEKSTALAHSLAALGVAKGDRVVTLYENSVDVFTTWYAINKLGGIWVPINRAYRGEFLRHQVSDAGARVALCDQEYLERFVELAETLPELKLLLCRGPGPYPDCRLAIQALDDHRGNNTSPLPIVVEPGDLAALLYTSGTTGPSKGCMISHNYMCSQGRQMQRIIPQERHETTWTPLPLFHSAALQFSLRALTQGHHVVIARNFSLKTFWDDIERAGATSASLMATIFSLVAHAPDTPASQRYFGKLRTTIGVPVSPEVRKIWSDRFGVERMNTWAYGQTEGSALGMVTPDEEPPLLSAGRIADEFEATILDDDDQPVPDGTVGNLCYRPRAANCMFEGYWGRPEHTIRAWKNLWMHSGDLARMENGWLYFCDRAKDYLRARGENISSFEVEAAYSAHPDIAEVAVHATGTQTGDDEMKVTIVLRADANVGEHALCLWSIDRLPYFAVPRYYELRTELPKNPTGRVLKYQLREEGVTSTTWDREVAGVELRRRK